MALALSPYSDILTDERKILHYVTWKDHLYGERM